MSSQDLRSEATAESEGRAMSSLWLSVFELAFYQLVHNSEELSRPDQQHQAAYITISSHISWSLLLDIG